MITGFGSLLAGHVDLDNIGLQGTPTNDRWYSNEHLATVCEKTQAIAQEVMPAFKGKVAAPATAD